MAWTTSKTWVVGEVLTAAGLNTYLRDNLNALRAFTRATQSGFSSNTFGAVAVTPVFDNFGTSWGGSYWQAPYSGVFETVANVQWGGASGGGSAGIYCYWATSAGVLIDDVCKAETAVLNGSASATGLAVMTAGDRLYFQGRNGATGTAGSLLIRLWVAARG